MISSISPMLYTTLRTILAEPRVFALSLPKNYPYVVFRINGILLEYPYPPTFIADIY